MRPKTLAASIAPVLLGTAMAYGDGVEHWPSAALALVAALLIQVGTNFANDYYDFKSGVDSPAHLGPLRVVESGLVPPKSMQCAFILVFLFAALASACLALRGGMPIVIIAVTALLSGFFYTAGPFPLGYIGLGEIFAFLFFGPIAVAGTYYVQSFEMNSAVIMAGFMPGFLSAAILVVNNLRDIDTDRRAGKRTWAVFFGRTFSRVEYFFCVTAAFANF